MENIESIVKDIQRSFITNRHYTTDINPLRRKLDVREVIMENIKRNSERRMNYNLLIIKKNHARY